MMNTAIRIALLQLGLGLMVALLWGAADRQAFAPAACGGAIAALLTFYSGVRFLGRSGGHPREIVQRFYGAMARKLALAIVLFAGAVHVFGYNFAPLITAFSVSLAAYWLALLWNLGTN